MYVWKENLYIRKCISGAAYIYLDSKLLFSMGTFDSFLSGLGRNQFTCCSAQTAHKPVETSLTKQTTEAKSLLS